MQNIIKRYSIICILVLALLLLAGCGSNDKGKDDTDDTPIFTVLLRDSEGGTHYQLEIKRSECTDMQASVLDRLQNSGERITVSVPKAPENMSSEERQALIAAVIDVYEKAENTTSSAPETPSPVDPKEEWITLSLSDRKSGALYDFTFDATDLNDTDKALIQAKDGTVLLDIEKDPVDMTNEERNALLKAVLSELYAPIPSENPKATVLIDAGHGFTNSNGVPDKGTGEGTPYYELTKQYESDLNLAIALRLKEKLIKAGYAVIMIREDEVDEYLSVNDRVRRINAMGADIMISIHGNAASESASGARVYWHHSNVKAEISEAYASTVADAINGVAGTTLVQAKVYEGDYAVVRDVHIPSVLVETCFLTNVNDANLVSDPLWVERMADALCNGVDNQCSINK